MENSARAQPRQAATRDDREWMIEHFEARLHELMRKGVHRIRPDITERYEIDLMKLSKGFRMTDGGDDEDEE